MKVSIPVGAYGKEVNSSTCLIATAWEHEGNFTKFSQRVAN